MIVSFTNVSFIGVPFMILFRRIVVKYYVSLDTFSFRCFADRLNYDLRLMLFLTYCVSCFRRQEKLVSRFIHEDSFGTTYLGKLLQRFVTIFRSQHTFTAASSGNIKINVCTSRCPFTSCSDIILAVYPSLSLSGQPASCGSAPIGGPWNCRTG